MHRPHRVRLAQQLDRALDLAPLTEMDNVTDRAAAIGALRGLDRRHLPEQGDKLLRLVEPGTIDMNMSIQVALPSLSARCREAPVSISRMLIINRKLITATGLGAAALP